VVYRGSRSSRRTPREVERIVFQVDMGASWEEAKRRIGVTDDMLYKIYCRLFSAIEQCDINHDVEVTGLACCDVYSTAPSTCTAPHGKCLLFIQHRPRATILFMLFVWYFKHGEHLSLLTSTQRNHWVTANTTTWKSDAQQTPWNQRIPTEIQNDYIMNGHLSRDSRYVRGNRGLSKLLHERPT
jgi:hypothetical protein